jgi:hypothetical protein
MGAEIEPKWAFSCQNDAACGANMPDDALIILRVRFHRKWSSSLLKWLNSLYRPALPEGIRGRTRPAAFQTALGRRQVVRQWILIPPYGGSNPPAPAKHSKVQETRSPITRKARQWRPFTPLRSVSTVRIGDLGGQIAKSLRPTSRIFPFSRDYGQRFGSIATAARPWHSAPVLSPVRPYGNRSPGLPRDLTFLWRAMQFIEESVTLVTALASWFQENSKRALRHEP